MNWYIETIDNILKHMGTDANKGLSDQKAAELLQKFGENILEGKKNKSMLQKLLAQLNDYMVLILIAAAVISFVVALLSGEGDYIDSIIIISIVILNAILGVVQESNAEKALDALKGMSAPSAKVIRNGVTSHLPSSKLVPGDIIVLEAGDFVPADARLLECASLKCEESALTGESVPVDKDAKASVAENAPIGDRLNMVYSGCSTTYGRATAVVTGTGMNTEMGKIADLLNKEKEELTPLQQKLNLLGKYLGILAIVICAIIFAVGLFEGEELIEMFMTSVSLAVAAIPEGLTAVVTIVLAIGVQRMVKKNAIIRKLTAVETLGSASIICSDKTGTLTQNKMTVKKLWVDNAEIAQLDDNLSDDYVTLLQYGILCNDGNVTMTGTGEQHIGDPTETAIVAAALKKGIIKKDEDTKYKRVAEIPFDSDRKLMTTVHIMNGKPIAIVKGGFDVLLPKCINPPEKGATEVNSSLADDALRVLAVAYKNLESVPSTATSEELETGLTFVGLIGMIDPPREESKAAVATCVKAGIKTVMITGDHVSTASAIARELGILKDKSEAISGVELANISEEQLAADVTKYAVYARVSPEDKIKIVKAWQANGHVVSMTGDGVNDAPALKAADIGCAMGITGTDVAKGAADMVLTDDNFSTIVEAVKQGRGIYANIKKTIEFLLGSNLGEVIAVFFSMIFGWGSPLLAIHLLLVNVVTDAFPALALGVEEIDKDIMDRKPIPKNEGIFAHGLGLKIALQGLMIAILTLAAYYIGYRIELSPDIASSQELGRTMAFLVLAISQLVQALNCRSHLSLFKIGFASNKVMLYATAVSLGIILLVTLVPPIASIFKMAPLSSEHWLWIIGLSIVPFFVLEIAKFIMSKVER